MRLLLLWNVGRSLLGLLGLERWSGQKFFGDLRRYDFDEDTSREQLRCVISPDRLRLVRISVNPNQSTVIVLQSNRQFIFLK